MPRLRARTPRVDKTTASTMKLLFTACFLLLLLLNGAPVECRRHTDRRHHHNKERMLFVFGDSFVDAGNVPPSQTAPQWSYPYGSSDSAHHNNATGRFSDGLVQSDFLAMILGRDNESPPPYRLRQANEVDPSGVNFALAGSGALVASADYEPSSLATQIDQFRRLVRHEIVEERDLKDSVALIAFSGLRDYQSVTMATSSDDMRALSTRVTDAIADCVDRLQDLGVSKVLVNTLPPLGCQPFQAWNYKYAHCDSLGNTLSDMHNAALRHKLHDLQDVLVLDIHAAFTDLVQSRYSLCCAGDEHDSFCGLEDDQGNALYKLCPDPENFFYWDYLHPTQAAWEAVMDILQQPIQDFLGIQ